MYDLFDEKMTMLCTIKKIVENVSMDAESYDLVVYTDIPCFYEEQEFTKLNEHGQVVRFSGCIYFKADAPIDIEHPKHEFFITSPIARSGIKTYQINKLNNPNDGTLHHFEVWTL